MSRAEIAIATSFSVAGTSDPRPAACGLLKWCFSASQLATAPFLSGRAEVVVFTEAPTHEALSECHPAALLRVVPYGRALRRIVGRWSLAANRSGLMRGRMASRRFSEQALLKWEALRHTEYNCIFLTDPDVDLFFDFAGQLPPTGSRHLHHLRRAWTAQLARFRSSAAQLVASVDGASPINAGVLMLKPSVATYDRGIRVLDTLRWHVVHGFNGTGSPRDALRGPLRLQRVEQAFNRTSLLTLNHWGIPGGDADQGLLIYVFLVLERAVGFRLAGLRYSTRANGDALEGQPCSGTDCGPVLRHFWAGDKPWRAGATCLRYFDFLNATGFRTIARKRSRCLDLFERKRSALLRARQRNRERFEMRAACRGRPQLVF